MTRRKLFHCVLALPPKGSQDEIKVTETCLKFSTFFVSGGEEKLQKIKIFFLDSVTHVLFVLSF